MNDGSILLICWTRHFCCNFLHNRTANVTQSRKVNRNCILIRLKQFPNVFRFKDPVSLRVAFVKLNETIDGTQRFPKDK